MTKPDTEIKEGNKMAFVERYGKPFRTRNFVQVSFPDDVRIHGLNPIGTVLHTVDGDEIKGVQEVKITARPNEAVTAEITIGADFNDVWALPFMSEVSFLEAAKRYGYEVEKKKP